ncbi:hypothetical protein ACOBQX_27860 [Actinokineospora sp. G85]|uniref:hypothetical protein n=1 Tax=Actinokineospora sp. G85 TaxID=3406626 RepID=UPI003C743ACA
MRIAEEAGDRELASYGLVRQALLTMYQGDGRSTVELAQLAQRSSTPSRVLGLAAQREAQGHALVGDHTACMYALERAARHFAKAVEAPMAGPTLGTSHVSDPVGVVTGWCLVDLGRPVDAAEVLDREVAAIPPTAQRARARFGVRQALAHAAAGEVDRACEIAAEMLPLALAVDSETINSDVYRLSVTLRRWRDHPAVTRVHPLLVAVLASGRGSITT